MKYYFFLLCFILGGASTSLMAQRTMDLFTLSGLYGFPKDYEEQYDGRGREVGGMLNAVVPIKVAERTFWYNSINYFHWRVRNDVDFPQEIADPISLHGIMLQTGIYHKFDERNGIQVLFSPRLMSDFQNIKGKHFQFGGTFLYERKYHEDLTLSYGALYNQELFGAYLVPLVNLYWKISDRWSIFGLLPIYSKIAYKASKSFSFGINHFGLITTYKLGDEDYSGDYIERRSIDVGLFGRLKISGPFYIEGRVGYSLDRNYEQYAASDKVDFSIPLVTFGDDRVQKNVSFHDGGYANLRLVYSIELPN